MKGVTIFNTGRKKQTSIKKMKKFVINVLTNLKRCDIINTEIKKRGNKNGKLHKSRIGKAERKPDPDEYEQYAENCGYNIEESKEEDDD